MEHKDEAKWVEPKGPRTWGQGKGGMRPKVFGLPLNEEAIVYKTEFRIPLELLPGPLSDDT